MATACRAARRSRTDYYGYLFILPFCLAFLIFGLYPVYQHLLSQLHEYDADEVQQ